MKKILYMLIATILFSNIALSQELNLDINQILQTTSMPSDAEITQMLETLGVPQEEKEFLFNETKKRLEQMYNTKDASAYSDLYQNMSNIPPLDNNEQLINNGNKRTKKYTNHAPLTRR